MDINTISENVLKEYNNQKEKDGKADFRAIISLHYKKEGVSSGLSYNDFFNKVSTKCHELQPGSKSMKKALGDKIHKAHKKFKFSTGILTEEEVEKVERNRIRQLGGGRYEEGLEYYEQILNG